MQIEIEATEIPQVGTQVDQNMSRIKQRFINKYIEFSWRAFCMKSIKL